MFNTNSRERVVLLCVLILLVASSHVRAQTDPLPSWNSGTQPLYDEAKRNGWIVISMKNDWKRVFAFDP